MAVSMAAVALVAGGCGQNSANPGHSPSVSPRPSASPSSGSQTPTGTQLGALLTHAQLPTGWGPVSGAIPEDDSGPYVGSPEGPQNSAHGCAIMGSDMVSEYFTDWWSVSDASYTIEDTGLSNPANAVIVGLSIAAYRPAGDAAQTLSMAASLASTCKSFTDSSGNPVTVSAATAPGFGSQGFYLQSTTNVSGAGLTLSQLLLAQVGSYVIGVDADNPDSSGISQATVDRLATLLVRLSESG